MRSSVKAMRSSTRSTRKRKADRTVEPSQPSLTVNKVERLSAMPLRVVLLEKRPESGEVFIYTAPTKIGNKVWEVIARKLPD